MAYTKEEILEQNAILASVPIPKGGDSSRPTEVAAISQDPFKYDPDMGVPETAKGRTQQFSLENLVGRAIEGATNVAPKRPSEPVDSIIDWDYPGKQLGGFFDAFGKDAQAPFQHDPDRGGLETAAALYGNLPYSLGRRGGELIEVATDPVGTMSAIGKILLGTGELYTHPSSLPSQLSRRIGEAVGLQPGEAREATIAAGKGLAQQFSPENLVEDPLGAAATVASVAYPPLAAAKIPAATRGASLAQQVTKGAKFLQDPAMAAVEAVAPAAGATGRFVGRTTKKITEPIVDFGTEVLSRGLGSSSNTLREALRAGLEGNKEVLLNALEKNIVSEDVAKEIEKALAAAVADIKYGPRLKEMAEHVVINTKDLKSNIENFLVDWNVKKTSLFGEDAGPYGEAPFNFKDSTLSGSEDRIIAQKMLEDVWNDIKLGTNIDAIKLDVHKKGFSKYINDRANSRELKAFANGLKDLVRQPLIDNVKGYKGLSNEWEYYTTLEKDVADAFSITRKDTNLETASLRVADALKTDRGTRKRVISQLETTTDAPPIRAQIAGIDLSDKTPLLSRFGGVAGISGAAYFTGLGLPESIALSVLSLPVFTPKRVGRALVEAGAGAKKFDEARARAVKAVEELARKMREQGIVSEHMTVGEAIKRLSPAGQAVERLGVDTVGVDTVGVDMGGKNNKKVPALGPRLRSRRRH